MAALVDVMGAVMWTPVFLCVVPVLNNNISQVFVRVGYVHVQGECSLRTRTFFRMRIMRKVSPSMRCNALCYVRVRRHACGYGAFGEDRVANVRRIGEGSKGYLAILYLGVKYSKADEAHG